jgi:hypothetical protein
MSHRFEFIVFGSLAVIFFVISRVFGQYRVLQHGTESRLEVLGREIEMETTPETKKGKMQLKDYVRWFFVGAFGLIILFTVIMAAYRKFGG